ncbi:hypothetical protein CC79DRAFT_1330108 [Sarocladium strictum]
MADPFGSWSRQDILALIQVLLALLQMVPLVWAALNIIVDYRWYRRQHPSRG